MRLSRTPFLFPLTVFAILRTTLAHADFQAGQDAYERGDYSTPLQEWQPQAEQGVAQAQYNLGCMYESGRGVSQDDTEAVRWLRLAAAQGYAEAQYNLGVMYHNGRGVPQDNEELP